MAFESREAVVVANFVGNKSQVHEISVQSHQALNDRQHCGEKLNKLGRNNQAGMKTIFQAARSEVLLQRMQLDSAHETFHHGTMDTREASARRTYEVQV